MDTVARVKQISAERNISLYELSQLAGISYSTLKNAEQRNGQLKVDTIERICCGLHISMSQFFETAMNSAAGDNADGQQAEV